MSDLRSSFYSKIKDIVLQESIPGILLASATILALLIANSPLGTSYEHLLHAHLGPLTLHQWVNDGLMVIFFFVVGMEIKYELVEGQLADLRQASLPIAAAIGGMLGPALIYWSLNPAYPASRGWGIPMATDIAFALAALSLFGRRVPLALKVFLMALAIVDDLGAVLVIAIFYTKEIGGLYLGLGGLVLLGVFLLQKIGEGRYFFYLVLGILFWLAIFKSGIHPTIAGVLLGLATPLYFKGKTDRVSSAKPLHDLVHGLHPYVNLLIMPVFALTNAGIRFVGGGAEISTFYTNSIFQGVAAGLFLGKPIGILLLVGLSVVLGLSKIPAGIRWIHIAAVSILAGIGFTMSLFVSGLALYPEQEFFSKLAILIASLAAAAAGGLLLHFSLPRSQKDSSSYDEKAFGKH